MVEYRLCLVKWRDVLATSGWEKDADCPEILSVGWHIYEDDSTLKIANTLDYEDFSEEHKEEEKPIPYGLTAFPKGCVVEITYLDTRALGVEVPPSPIGANLHSIHTPDSATVGNA